MSARRVQIDNKTLESPQVFIKELSALGKRKKQKTPDFEIENQTARDTRIFGISVAPDALFRNLGVIEIWLNDVRLFPYAPDETVQGMLRFVDVLNIPIPANYGLKLKPSKKLQAFTYDLTLGSNARCNFACFIGDILERR